MSKKIIAITVVIIKIHNHTRTRVYLKKITKHVSHQCFWAGLIVNFDGLCLATDR